MKTDIFSVDNDLHNNDGVSEEDQRNIQNLGSHPAPTKVEVKSILKNLLVQVNKVDFKKLADMKESGKLMNNHLQIITTEQTLKIAQRNQWNICKSGECVYVFNSKYWEVVDEEMLKRFLGESAEKLGVDKFKARAFNFRDQLYKQFLALSNIPQKELSSDSVLVNLQNGTYEVNMKGGVLRHFDQADFLTYQLPFAYDAEAKADTFSKFLNKVLPDINKQKVLSEYMAYIFINQSDLKLEKTLLLYGTGANGKSVFFDVINALLGSTNVSNFGLNQLTSDNGYHRAMIQNKLINYSSEISNKLEADMFKRLSSGEPVEARSPYGKPYTITQYAKMVFNCNELPRDVENSKAFFRRFLIIHFDVTIPEQEQDKTLANKIIAGELSGVFNWILEGLTRLLDQKQFTQCEAISDLLTQYEMESDSVKLFISESEYIVDHRAQRSFKEFYDEYKEFCKDGNFMPVNKKTFKRRLLDYGIGIAISRINTGYVINISEKGKEVF